MDARRFEARERARELARGDALGWFERLYQEAHGESARIPWADRDGHPLLVEWLAREPARVRGKRALAALTPVRRACAQPPTR